MGWGVGDDACGEVFRMQEGSGGEDGPEGRSERDDKAVELE
jgi:hypothetical protein